MLGGGVARVCVSWVVDEEPHPDADDLPDLMCALNQLTPFANVIAPNTGASGPRLVALRPLPIPYGPLISKVR